MKNRIHAGFVVFLLMIAVGIKVVNANAEIPNIFTLSSQKTTIRNISFSFPIYWRTGDKTLNPDHFHLHLHGTEDRGVFPKDGIDLQIYVENSYTGDSVEAKLEQDRDLYVRAPGFHTTYPLAIVGEKMHGYRYESRWAETSATNEQYDVRTLRALIAAGPNVFVFTITFGADINQDEAVRLFDEILLSLKTR